MAADTETALAPDIAPKESDVAESEPTPDAEAVKEHLRVHLRLFELAMFRLHDVRIEQGAWTEADWQRSVHDALEDLTRHYRDNLPEHLTLLSNVLNEKEFAELRRIHASCGEQSA